MVTAYGYGLWLQLKVVERNNDFRCSHFGVVIRLFEKGKRKKQILFCCLCFDFTKFGKFIKISAWSIAIKYRERKSMQHKGLKCFYYQ